MEDKEGILEGGGGSFGYLSFKNAFPVVKSKTFLYLALIRTSVCRWLFVNACPNIHQIIEIIFDLEEVWLSFLLCMYDALYKLFFSSRDG